MTAAVLYQLCSQLISIFAVGRLNQENPGSQVRIVVVQCKAQVPRLWSKTV